MASSQKLISILFLFISLFSVQIHAREFFSKIPNVNVKTNEQVTSVVPNKEEQQTTLGKTEQEPRFMPETQNGYGLYGHESGQFPPSTTNTKETHEPYVTPVKYHPDEPYNAIPASKNNNKGTYFYSKNDYESTEQQNLGQAEKESWSTKGNKNEQNFGDAMFTEKGWTTKENEYNNGQKQNLGEAEKESWSTKENKNEQNFGDAMFTEKGWTAKDNEYNNGEKQNLGEAKYFNGNNGFNGEKQNLGEAKYYNGNNGFNGEKQGMSDTRFLENGKYYHDLKSDHNFGESMSNEKNNKYYNGNNRYNGEKQGMSDTRFLENGKYFHDLKSENNYYPNQFENSRRVASRNEFDENRYNNNNMGRYNQNQEEFEENEEEEFEP